MAEIGRSLDARQDLACALRILAPDWQENLSGHITFALDDGSLLVNPWGLWWSEVRASDIVRIDAAGAVLEGEWDVTPAVHLHTELHRSRDDARVVIHNHPHFATLLACLGVLPVIAHQNSAIFAEDLVLVDEYDGTVESASAGAELARRVGNATGVLLANHGAIVTGSTIADAAYKATTFERMCRFTAESLMASKPLRPLPGWPYRELKAELYRNAPDAFWRGAVRQLLQREPEVLECRDTECRDTE
jgi:ribulose-5-phosphate 4-epimerase/fuculose-1-phosphate aldolase